MFGQGFIISHRYYDKKLLDGAEYSPNQITGKEREPAEKHLLPQNRPTIS